MKDFIKHMKLNNGHTENVPLRILNSNLLWFCLIYYLQLVVFVRKKKKRTEAKQAIAAGFHVLVQLTLAEIMLFFF